MRTRRFNRVSRVGRVSGGSVFTPFSIPGLFGWGDPTCGKCQEGTGASATTPAAAANDPVGTWLWRTGQYLVAPGTGAGQRPTLQFGANSKPFLLADGANGWLTQSTGTLTCAEPLTY